MDYAISIKGAGVVIAARDCDYGSYLEEFLQCPQCSASVYLRAAESKQRQPHFCHFPQTEANPLKDCSLRTGQKVLSAEDLELLERKAEAQQFRLLSRRFWVMFCDYYDSNDFSITKVLQFSKDSEHIREITSQVAALFFRRKDSVFAAFDEILQTLVSGHSVSFSIASTGVTMDARLQAEFLKVCSSSSDRTIQRKICQRVLQFLFQPRMSPVVEDLLAMATLSVFATVAESDDNFGMATPEGDKMVRKLPMPEGESHAFLIEEGFWRVSSNRAMIYSLARQQVLLWLCLVPWTEQFLRFADESYVAGTLERAEWQRQRAIQLSETNMRLALQMSEDGEF